MDRPSMGIVDVGGGYRGVYACGVLDACMERGIRFDLGIGVSAGSANLISYCAGQRGRNLRFYTDYGLRKAYASMRNFMTKHTFIDLDYVYGTLSNSDGEDPLDYDAAMRSPMAFYAVATEAETGQAHYFDKAAIPRDDYSVMKASCALPFVCHPYAVNGTPYFDGALSDPVPVAKAFELGCERVVLLLTLPEDTVRTSERDEKVARRIQKQYPQAAAQLCRRAERYNAGVALAREYAAQGRLLIVAPDDTCGVHTLCRDAEAMHRLYEKGRQDAEAIANFANRP